MSIEQQLENLTAAVRELTAALAARGAPEVPKETSLKVMGKLKTAPTAPVVTQTTVEPPPAVAQPEKAPYSAPVLDYEKDVKPRFLKLVALKGRDVAIGVIKSFKPTAGRLDEAITPEQYPAAIDAIEKAMR